MRRDVVDPPTPMFRVNGKPAIGLAIAMRDQGDILALGTNVRRVMADVTAALPVGVEPTLVADQAAIVDHAINDFLMSLLQAIIIILACSFLSLGVRPGIVVALAIPLTLAVVFTVMNYMHIDLQRVSLGALIIALTLLVDDAMTTVDAMMRRLALGDSPNDAASFAYRTLAAPMLIGTLVTIASFVPIGFAPGGASEVLSSLFSVVAIALIASWLVAVIFGPIIGKAILKAPTPKADAKPSKLLSAYGAFLGAAIRGRWLTIGVTIGMFALSIFMLQFVPRQFFPSSDRPELTVDLTLRQSSSIRASEATAIRVEALLKDNPDVDHFSTYVGRGAIRFYLPLSVHLANPFFSQIIVVAKSIEARERVQAKLEQVLAVEFPEVVSRVSPLEMGPPVGWPLQYRVVGPDKDEVRRIALDVANLMGADTRVRTINYDWMEPARQVRVHIDQDEARRLGVSSNAISAVLQASVTGSTITQVRDDIYLVNVVARATANERASFETLASLQVPTPTGRMVPLAQFARFTEEQEFPLVWRRDRVPTLTVRADVSHGVLPETVVAAIGPSIAAYDAKLPRPYRVETGGLYESSNDSSANVFSVVPMMILLMLLFMMILLTSFRRLAMVVVIMPLGLIGVVAALLLFNRPLGFVAILGILALIGMIAKNAVILIVSIETERAAREGTRRSRDFGDQGPPDAADPDRDLDGARADSDRADNFLGSDGDRDHGRVAGGVAADADPAARSLRRCVRQRKTRGTGAGHQADVTADRAVLELHVAEMRQLFNAMDPAPFRERDLDPNAYSYIVDWGRETAARQPLGLVVQLSRETATPGDVGMLRDAVRTYFAQRADATRRQLRQLFRVGRISLLIGLAFLAFVIVVGEYLSLRIDKESYGYLVKESLIIAGWVALWRPLEIFLYDWWPIRAEATLLDRLSEMTVRVLTAPAPTVVATA